jgi:hypothetical protein
MSGIRTQNFSVDKIWVRVRVSVVVTLSTISDISWWPVLSWRTPGYPEKTFDLLQITDRLYHIILDQVLHTMSGIRTHNMSGDRH